MANSIRLITETGKTLFITPPHKKFLLRAGLATIASKRPLILKLKNDAYCPEFLEEQRYLSGRLVRVTRGSRSRHDRKIRYFKDKNGIFRIVEVSHLRQQWRQTINDMGDLNSKAVKKKRELTSEEEQQWDRMNKDQETLKRQIRNLQKQSVIGSRNGKRIRPPRKNIPQSEIDFQRHKTALLRKQSEEEAERVRLRSG